MIYFIKAGQYEWPLSDTHLKEKMIKKIFDLDILQNGSSIPTSNLGTSKTNLSIPPFHYIKNIRESEWD
ncbi:hypothetical protein [Pinibacter aurantiacus]|uniref:Uncharacterized protein n=1 Tax=Pinibacter aurantiacus TaxID=2851599 RepID=A0A9E2W7A7_9BACT|nr:hypothetical protein [Pinibacter aurantiacus]MBV4356296.1 hypothetical protein [Pinibacter aurantiacus]